MFNRMAAILAVRTRWVLYATIIGAVVYVVLQHLLSKGSQDLVAYLGAQVVTKGQYDVHLRPWIGWGVHVAMSYLNALFYCIVAYVPFAGMQSAARVAFGAFVAVLLAWVTSMFTAPAVAIAIGVFASKGVPKILPPLALKPGLPLWYMLAFFTVCYIFIVFIPMYLHARAEHRSVLEPDSSPEELQDPDKSPTA